MTAFDYLQPTIQKMIHHKIKVQKTAHYFTQGTINDTTQYFWIVAHGFGQLYFRLLGFVQKSEI